MEDSIERRLQKLEERNLKVEGNKRWETSIVRRASIAILTYIVVVIYHLFIDADRVFIISLVPVMGFLISTLSLQFIRSKFDAKRK